MKAPRLRRLPPNYRLVHDVVRAQAVGVHAPASDIFARARAVKPTLGYSTVYRALDRLCRTGLVLELHVPGLSAALYEPARPGHAHFVCRACGRVEDVDCEPPGREIAASVAARGGEIDAIALTIHGRCAPCRGRIAPAADGEAAREREGPPGRGGRNA